VQKIKKNSFYPAVKNKTFIAFARKKTSTSAARTCSTRNIRVTSLKCFMAALRVPGEEFRKYNGSLKNGMKIRTQAKVPGCDGKRTPALSLDLP
jgi:hypothetical protein